MLALPHRGIISTHRQTAHHARPYLTLHFFFAPEQFIASQFYISVAAANSRTLKRHFLTMNDHRSGGGPPSLHAAAIAALVSRSGQPTHFVFHDQSQQLQLGFKQHVIDAASQPLRYVGQWKDQLNVSRIVCQMRAESLNGFPLLDLIGSFHTALLFIGSENYPEPITSWVGEPSLSKLKFQQFSGHPPFVLIKFFGRLFDCFSTEGGNSYET